MSWTPENIGVGRYKVYEGEVWLLCNAMPIEPGEGFVVQLYHEGRGELRRAYVAGFLPTVRVDDWLTEDVVLAARVREAQGPVQAMVDAWTRNARRKRGNPYAAIQRRRNAKT